MVTNKKILFITTSDDMIWHFLLPHIKHLQDAGNAVECACAKTGFWFDEIKDTYGTVMHEVPFARSPYRFIQNKRAFKQLSGVIKASGFDLIHCHQPVGGVMGRKAGAKFNIPVLYIAHGFHFYKGAPFKNNLIYKAIEKHYARKTDALITINEEDFKAAKKMKAKKVYKINGIGCDPEKTAGIPFDKKVLQAETGIRDEDVTLISVGELNKNKNHIAIIKAVAELKIPNIKYLICGQGPLMDKYKELIKRLGLEDKVELLGYRKDVRNVLKIADIFIMPSLREGLTMAMVEAMYESLPVIASKIRGCCDLVEHGGNGLLVPLNEKNGFSEAIAKLVQDSGLRAEMGGKSKDSVNKFLVKEVLGQTEVIYDELF